MSSFKSTFTSVVSNPFVQGFIRNDNLSVPAIALPLLLAFNVSHANAVPFTPDCAKANTTTQVVPSQEMQTHLNEVKRRFTF